jgi:Arc/MetJ-type ribon-helix-helix transcriptional regulator
MPTPPSENPRFKRVTVLLTVDEFDALKKIENASEVIRYALAGRLNRDHFDSSIIDTLKKAFGGSIDLDEKIKEQKNEARRKADEKMAKRLKSEA